MSLISGQSSIANLQQLVNQGSIRDALNGALKTALFMEAVRNLNWARGYLWYCELDGVPNPFHRGGVIGLPVRNLTYNLTGNASSMDITNNSFSFSIPQKISQIDSIQLSLYDDELGTLRQFFERWYNEVYNPYLGTLPLTEACKCLSIYHQSSTRRNTKRVYYNIDVNQTLMNDISNPLSFLNSSKVIRSIIGDHRFAKNADAINLFVYPTNSLVVSGLDSGSDGLIELQATLKVAHFSNQDFGDPGIKSSTANPITGDENSTNWINNIVSYI